MQNKKIVLTAFCLSAVAILGFWLGERKGTERDAAPVVRTYNVPPGRAAEIRNALNGLFFQKRDEAPMGTVQVFGGGLMIVRAPQAYQEGITHFVEELSQDKGAERSLIQVRYWMVVGEEAKGSGAEAIPSLAPALNAIEKVDGPRKFRILENFSSVIINGNKSKIESPRAELELSAAESQGKVGVDLALRSSLGKIATYTQVTPGEFVVFGQNALIPQDEKANAASVHANVYHILRVELVK